MAAEDAIGSAAAYLRVHRLDTEVLVASVRHPMHVQRAARMGAHVATCPLSVLLQLAKHPLTDIGLERFLKDWEKVPK